MFLKTDPRRGAGWFVRPIALAAIVCATVFCTPVLRAEEQKHVLFINPGFVERGFWKSVSDTMLAAADSLGFRLTVVSADRKWPLMVSRGLEALRNTDPDYVILVNENQQAPRLLEAADIRGIPTLLLLNSLTDEQESTYGAPRSIFKHWIGSITPDNAVAGYEMAKSLEQAARKSDKTSRSVALLSLAGDFKTPASIDRLAGLDRALNESDSLKEVRRLTVNWSEDEAYERTSILARQTVIDAVWAANDPIAIGAIRALKEQNLTPGRDFFVAGLNWSTDAVSMVRRGEMTMTHGGHFLAGAYAMVLLYDYDRGRDFADIGHHLHFPMSAITADNADLYTRYFGNEDWSKIDYRALSRADHPERLSYEFTLTSLLASIRVQ